MTKIIEKKDSSLGVARMSYDQKKPIVVLGHAKFKILTIEALTSTLKLFQPAFNLV